MDAPKYAVADVVLGLWNAGYRLRRGAEWFIKAPKKATAEFRKLIQADRTWYFEVPCSRGGKVAGNKAHIYVYSDTHLAYSGMGMRLRKKLLAVAGVRSHQTGDEEFSVVFPITALPGVASVVRAQRRSGSKSPVKGGFNGPRNDVGVSNDPS